MRAMHSKRHAVVSRRNPAARCPEIQPADKVVRDPDKTRTRPALPVLGEFARILVQPARIDMQGTRNSTFIRARRFKRLEEVRWPACFG